MGTKYVTSKPTEFVVNGHVVTFPAGLRAISATNLPADSKYKFWLDQLPPGVNKYAKSKLRMEGFPLYDDEVCPAGGKRGRNPALKIAEYEVEDIGVDGAQYFPGRGTMPENVWDTVAVGIGEDYNEALGDALEDLAQQEDVADGELDRIERKEKVSQKKADKHSVSVYREQYAEPGDAEPDEDFDDELNYYVAIYVKWSE